MRNYVNYVMATATLIGLLLINAAPTQAQVHKQSKVLVAKKVSGQQELRIGDGNLTQITRNNYHESGRYFKNLQVVQTGVKQFYLITEVQNSNDMFAFELVKKGKRLYSTKYQEMHTCSCETKGIDAFLQQDGKVVGCKKGNHSISIGADPKQGK